MHLYCLKILLTIPLCNIIPCLFQLNLFTGIYFSPVLFQAFRFLRPVKGLRIRLRPSGIFQMFSLYLRLHLQLFTYFTLPYLHLLAYTYLHLLIYTCVLFILLHELDKIDKTWEIQKQRRNFLDWRVFLVLKIIIQRQASEVFCKNAVLKNFAIFTGKQLCWILFLIKLQAFSPASLLKRDSNTGVFLCISRIFQEHLF